MKASPPTRARQPNNDCHFSRVPTAGIVSRNTPEWLSMFLRLFLLLTLVPVVELTILLEVYRGIANTWATGTGPGVLFRFSSIILSGLIGASLVRRQGLAVLRTIRATMARGEFPAHSLVDGALVLVGGTLLLTPGFLTDVAGFTLLVPWTRR